MKRSLIAALMTALAGCENPPTMFGCTDVGCLSGLYVTFDQQAPGAWKVELFPPGERSVLQSCSSDHTCSTAFFEGHLPKRVTLTVTHDGRTAHYANLETTSRVTYPNGRGCTPECRSVAVAVKLP